MPTKGHMTGMLGVYLTAAELSRRGLIVSVTSRSAIGADILATDERCQNAWSIQVKTNGKPARFWLIGKHAKETASKSHVYVFVNIKGEDRPSYYIVPSKDVAKHSTVAKSSTGSMWYAYSMDESYEDNWKALGLKE